MTDIAVVKVDSGLVKVTVANVGLPGAPGSQGESGSVGPQGASGMSGLNGTNGSSAYQIAVAEGFVGSASAWLASLKGEKGDPGSSGSASSGGGFVVMSSSQAPNGVPVSNRTSYVWPPGGVINKDAGLNSVYSYPALARMPIATSGRLKAAMFYANGNFPGQIVRLGIYAADKNWDIGTIAFDSGDIPVSSAGWKEVTGLDIPLAAGNYYAYIQASDNSVEIWAPHITVHCFPYVSGYGLGGMLYRLAAADVGALASTISITPQRGGQECAPFLVQFVAD